MKNILVAFMVVIMLASSVFVLADGGRSDNDGRDNGCQCSHLMIQALFLTNGWGGYGATEVFSVPGVLPVLPEIVTLTVNGAIPQNGNIVTGEFMFTGYFENGMPVYQSIE